MSEILTKRKSIQRFSDSKQCGDCREVKKFKFFNKDSYTEDGYCYRCRECNKNYKNSPKIRKQRRKRDSKKREEINRYQREHAKKNRIRYSTYQKKHYHKHIEERRRKNNEFYNSEKQKPKNNARSAKRRAAKIKRTPKWLTKEHWKQIEWFYTEAARLTKENGILYTVDHIIPLQGKNVSGLHVPWNLQIMIGPGYNGNFSKGNKY
jgi:hypothetical protein